MGDDLAGIIDLSGPTSLFNAIGRAPKITAPLLVVASRHDSVVSPKDSRELVAAADSEDKEVAIYPGAGTPRTCCTPLRTGTRWMR